MYYIYIDEAGRGPLAGPVYVGIVIEEVTKKKRLHAGAQTFPARKKDLYKHCADSKVLSELQRNSVYKELIINKQFHGTTANISAKDIDRHGIVWALRRGVARALHAFFVGGRCTMTSLLAWLSSQQHEICLVIDGPHDFGLKNMLGVDVITVVDGDALIPMVGAASILAKVERDDYMKRLATRHPQYGFEKHKGYGTKVHYEAIQKYGLCKEHRKSYIH